MNMLANIPGSRIQAFFVWDVEELMFLLTVVYLKDPIPTTTWVWDLEDIFVSCTSIA